MTIMERQSLRLGLVKDLYNYYFDNSGKEKLLEMNKLDDETKLAYDYLAEKGLITSISKGGKEYALKITAYGIDTIELS